MQSQDAGSRVSKYRHTLRERLYLENAELAILAELLLRGSQTPGELRTRAARMAEFPDLAEVESILQELMEKEPPMVTRLERQPGRKECRYAQLFSEVGEQPATEQNHMMPASNMGNPTDLDQLRAEVDALGSQRTSPNDVGEARRILNSFLQMIEQDHSNSVIICATNHAEILDYALFRRFDDVIQYQLPSKNEIITLFKNKLSPYVTKRFPWTKLATNAEGLSSAEVTLAAEDAIKELLIHDLSNIKLEMIQTAINDRREMSYQKHR